MMVNTASQATLLASMGNKPAAGVSAGLALAKGAPMDESRADKVSKDYESMFVSQMLDQMFAGDDNNEMFGDSETADIYKGMMVDQFGKEIAKSGGIGIAPVVKQELLKLQEV